MTLRRLLPVPLLVCAALGGYAGGAYLTARTIDRAAPTDPGDGAAARAALAALRAQVAGADQPQARLAAARADFLKRWPDSWLRSRWQAPPR